MKKTMILVLFLKFLIISSIDTEDFFIAKCEDDKPKTGACSYLVKDRKNDKKEYAIFDKCGKGKICDEVCVEQLKKRKSGESCKYDNDCLTGSCINNKCGGVSEGERCEYVNCQPGLVCSYDSSGYKKCVQPAEEGSIPQYTECMEGLEKDVDGKCAKYGTLDNGSKLRILSFYEAQYGYRYEYGNENEILCKSGASHLKIENNNYYYVCDTLETEPVCEDGYVKTEGKWTDGTKISIGSNSNCNRETDYTGAKKDYFSYSKLKSKLFEDFLKDYRDLDLKKLNSEEHSNLFTGKTYEKYFLYQNAPALKAAGIIDSDGNVVDSKKCEYEFIIKDSSDSSSFIKLKAIIIAIIALLF